MATGDGSSRQGDDGGREWLKQTANSRYVQQLNAGLSDAEAQAEYTIELDHPFVKGDHVVNEFGHTHVVVSTVPLDVVHWGIAVCAVEHWHDQNRRGHGGGSLPCMHVDPDLWMLDPVWHLLEAKSARVTKKKSRASRRGPRRT